MLTVADIQSTIKERIPADLVVPEHTFDQHFYRKTDTNNLFASVTTKAGIIDMPHLKQWAANLAIKHIDKNFHHITEETKEQIYKAAGMAHVDVLQDAGNVGTVGHNVVDDYLIDWMKNNSQPKNIKSYIKPNSDYRVSAIARSAEAFCNDFAIIPVASELLVASEKHNYAGTLDSLMMVARPVKKVPGGCDHNYKQMYPKRWQYVKCSECGQEAVLEFALVDWKTSNSVDKPEYAMQVSAYWYALWEMTGLRPKHIFIVQLDKFRVKYKVVRVVHRPSAFKAFLHCSKLYDWMENGENKLHPIALKERLSLSQL